MSLSHWVKDFDYRFILPTITKFPLPVAKRLVDWRGDLAYLLRRKARKTSIANMSLALPELTLRQIRRNVRYSCRALFRDESDSYWFHWPLDRLRALVEISGLDVLDSAMKSGQGVILFTGHIGSTGLFITALGKRGIPINLVFRSLEDIHFMPPAWYRYGNMRVQRLEKASGRPILHAGRTNYFSMRKRLRQGEIVLMGLDVIPSLVGRTVEVSFLGTQARFPDGIARLYLDTGARILFWHIHRGDRASHRAEIRDVTSLLPDTENRQRLTQAFVNMLEEEIRDHPEDWLQWEALEAYQSVDSSDREG